MQEPVPEIFVHNLPKFPYVNIQQSNTSNQIRLIAAPYVDHSWVGARREKVMRQIEETVTTVRLLTPGQKQRGQCLGSAGEIGPMFTRAVNESSRRFHSTRRRPYYCFRN